MRQARAVRCADFDEKASLGTHCVSLLLPVGASLGTDLQESICCVFRDALHFTPSPLGGEGGMRGLGRCDTETHRNPLTPPSPLRGEGVKRRAHPTNGRGYRGGI